MFLRHALIVLMLTSLLLGCSKSSDNSSLVTFDVPVKDAKNIQLSTIAMRIDSVPLETLSDHLISRIIDIDHDQEAIYVADVNALYKFTKSGEFIKQIGKTGQGPGEYLNVTDIALDRKTNKIYIASAFSQKIICYDTEGELVKESKVSGLTALKTVDELIYGVFTTYGIPTAKKSKRLNNTYLLKLSQNLAPIDTLLIKSVKVDKGTAALSAATGDQIISDVNGNLYVYHFEAMKEPFVRDTLFQIEDKKRTAALKLNFGIKNRIEEHIFVKSILRFSNHLLVDFSLKQYAGMAIINLPANKSLVAKEFFKDDLWNTGPVKLLPWDLKNEEFYFVKDAYELEQKFDGVNADDNPLIFIVKLKKEFF